MKDYVFSSALSAYAKEIERIVNKHAWQCGNALEEADLRQDAMLGLVHALEHKEERGEKAFCAYAKRCMEGRVLDLVERHACAVHVTDAMRDEGVNIYEEGFCLGSDYLDADRVDEDDDSCACAWELDGWDMEAACDKHILTAKLYELLLAEYGERDTAIIMHITGLNGELLTKKQTADKFGMTTQRVGQIVRKFENDCRAEGAIGAWLRSWRTERTGYKALAA